MLSWNRCQKLLTNGDLITSRCVFSLLSELMRVRQGLKEYLNDVIPLVVSTITQFKTNVSSDIITEALVVIQQFLECHEPAIIYPHISSLAKALVTIINICNEKDKDRVSQIAYILTINELMHIVNANLKELLMQRFSFNLSFTSIPCVSLFSVA